MDEPGSESNPPETGGMGATPRIILGSTAALPAALLLIGRKKRLG